MEAPTTSDRRVTDVVNAIGTAWATFTLYPNPVQQPAFQRAVSVLNDADHLGATIDIGAGTFSADGLELAGVRDGAQRLARELFIHDVEHLTVGGSCTAEGLESFFRLLEDQAATSEHDRAAFVARLESVANSGLSVDERSFLVDHEQEDEGAVDTSDDEAEYSLQGVALEAYRGAPAQELAAYMVQRGGDDDSMADAYTESFEELYEHLTPEAGRAQAVLGSLEAGDDPWKSVRNLIEAFFYLPRPVQLRVLETVLADATSERTQVFLDQFSGLDLAEFMDDLSEEAAAALLDYAVSAAGTAQGAPSELLGNLQSAKEVQDARKELSARVADLLRSAEDASSDVDRTLFDSVGDRLRLVPDFSELTRSVLRGLLECEVREDRFRRILRLWTGRIASAVREGDFETAGALLRAVLDDPPYAPDRDDDVRNALRRLAGPELLRSMAEHEEGTDVSPEVTALLELFGPVVVDELVRQLAVEEEASLRRTLIELLAISVRNRPRALDQYLDDTRWYVVRNLVTVLAKTGSSSAASSAKRMLTHDDHRVRIEAMRAIFRLMRNDGARLIVPMLADGNPRVRANAAALIKSTDSADIDELLGRELDNDSVHADVASAIVDLLAQRQTPAARAVLERLAGRKIAVSASARALRESAKRALKGA